MTYPDDRVLVGAITRKRDLITARDGGWYRVPQIRFPYGVQTEYVAFFLNARVAATPPGGIMYYARLAGVELVRRRDLLPTESAHPRADDVYYKLQLQDWQPRTPPITNPTRRTIAFIYTTWDRFVNAHTIADLYSRADYFVDRIYHALRNAGYTADRFWEAEQGYGGVGARVRLLCQQGAVTGSTQPVGNKEIFLDMDAGEDAVLARLQAAVAQMGGPASINIPLD